MSIAFVFPGQGSQIVGMGKELANNFASARAVFEEVDQALNYKLSKIIFEGSQEELTDTVNAQPALMAVSMAILSILEAEDFCLQDHVQFFAGHSLGEYSALCGAKAFGLTDTARLLAIRGKAMQEAVPKGKGAMAAIIGLEEQAVINICQNAANKGICQIANDNGGGQLVVSGEKEAIDYAVQLAKESGAKRALLLPVSAPFHSALMAPAARIMEEALSKVNISAPILPIISNVSVASEQDPERIKTLLVEQVTGQVRWRETIEWFAAHNVTKIYEIGAGKVLTGLIKRIDSTLQAQTISSYDEIKTILNGLND